jgi:hypothetical protein
MKLTTKLLLTLCGVALLAGAVPLFSDADVIPVISGTWAGEGAGWCNPPKTTLYAWQEWKGIVTKDMKTFYGEWGDKLGHHGKFKGEIKWISLTTAVATGIWTWDNNPGGVVKYDGKFQMTFQIFGKECKGTWDSIYPSTSPVKPHMWGKKVD